MTDSEFSLVLSGMIVSKRLCMQRASRSRRALSPAFRSSHPGHGSAIRDSTKCRHANIARRLVKWQNHMLSSLDQVTRQKRLGQRTVPKTKRPPSLRPSSSRQPCCQGQDRPESGRRSALLQQSFESGRRSPLLQQISRNVRVAHRV